MIKLNANINISSDKNESINNITTLNADKNNISSDISNIANTQKVAQNPFILGQNVIGDGSTLCSGVDYYISQRLTGNNKAFIGHGIGTSPLKVNIELSNVGAEYITIVFDYRNNVYPTSYSFNDKFISNNNSPFITNNGLGDLTIEYKFSALNRANSALVITGIYLGINVKISNNNIITIARKITDRDNNKLPSWGIISNKGNIEFVDFDERIKEFAEKQLLKQGLSVTINIQDTISDKKQQIGEFITDTWNYDNDNRTVSLSLTDELLEWQDILVNAYPLQPQKTMLDVYQYLHSVTPSKYNMTPYTSLDETTRKILSSTKCKYPYLEKGNLWNEWQKLCEICALHIYKKNDGTTTCVYDFIGG